MNRLLVLSAVLTSFMTVEMSRACTNVFVAADGARLVASNLDCNNYFPRIWFVPAGDDQHGRYCYGTDSNERIAEGGVNEHGLFIGVNALDKDTGWKPNPELPDWEEWEGWYGTGVPDGILARCASVEEAVKVFQSYNLFTLNRVKFLMADAGGVSVVVEWSDGALALSYRAEADFQVSTNFVSAGRADEDISCERYRIARRMLSDGSTPATVDGLRGVLSATHLEFLTPTVVSTICDLSTGELYVYYFHDYEQVLSFNLRKELARPRHGDLVADLVAVKPYVATLYEKNAAGGRPR
jgi:hypothetical protein